MVALVVFLSRHIVQCQNLYYTLLIKHVGKRVDQMKFRSKIQVYLQGAITPYAARVDHLLPPFDGRVV